MNTVRKCMTITKTNVQYVEDLIEQQEAKNFSNAVNQIINERREQNEKNIDSDSYAI